MDNLNTASVPILQNIVCLVRMIFINLNTASVPILQKWWSLDMLMIKDLNTASVPILQIEVFYNQFGSVFKYSFCSYSTRC